jgi:membrane protein YqaA with SNARE-associated domain
MSEAEVIKAISIFLLSSVKLFFAPGTSAAAGFGFWETVMLTSAGGVVGIFFFYFFGHAIFVAIDKFRRRNRKEMAEKKVFTRRNRFLIALRGKVGLIGLTLLTPALISIPIGCVVAAKYYYRHPLTLPLLLVFTIAWSLILSLFTFYVKDLIFGP